jgi:RNA polymerase sigma factor (sigma-70 family)
MARHDGLVHAVIRRQYGGSLSYLELLQAGRIGLWRALCSFDPHRGTAFSTYAWPAIAHQIWQEVAAAEPSRQEYLTAHPPLPPPNLEDIAERTEVYDCLYELIDNLPSHLQRVVLLYYGLRGHPPHSLRQLGRLLCISHEMVRQRLLTALVHLRHPANSLRLRQLLGRNSVADYEQADELAQRSLRKRGGRHGR